MRFGIICGFFLVFCALIRTFAAKIRQERMQTNSHLSRLIHDQAKKYGDREVLIYKDFGGTEWKSLSWNQFSQTVKQVSNALLNLGVKVQENVGPFGFRNHPPGRTGSCRSTPAGL